MVEFESEESRVISLLQQLPVPLIGTVHSDWYGYPAVEGCDRNYGIPVLGSGELSAPGDVIGHRNLLHLSAVVQYRNGVLEEVAGI